jgi:hypothetical protein
MSDIQVGDLVMTVRGHSCVMKAVGGVPFVVQEIVPTQSGGWACSRCGEFNAGPDTDAARFGKVKIPLPWLKKIPPLVEPETVEREERVSA